MSRRQLRVDLIDVRQLIADGRTELARRTGDREDYRLDSARHRLGDLDTLLVMATARRNGWIRTTIGAVIAFLGVLATASAARAIGLPGGWVIAVAVLTMLLLVPVTYRLTEELERALEWGGTRPARPLAVISSGSELAEVPEQLLRARTGLVSAIRRHVGPADWRVPVLARRVADDVTLIRLQDADLLLCQAIDQLETHLAERHR